ncbi:MAG: hypothetical protein EBR82_04675 [Caulobacteraceae bacterium]|nr:hypothetical protein [Caulobacteraceae bacterium]
MTVPVDRRRLLTGAAASLGVASLGATLAGSRAFAAPARLTALGDALDTAPRDLKSFDPRIVGDGRTDMTTRIAAALTSGARHIVIPADAGAYVVDGSMTLPAGYGLTVQGRPGAVLLQRALHERTLDGIGVDDCWIRDLKLSADYPRVYPGDRAFRGDNFYAGSSAIWLNGSRNRVTDVEIDGYVAGVWLSAWNGRENRVGSRGNLIERLRVSNVDMGILIKGQTDTVVRQVRARDITLSPGSPNPQHTIYATGNEAFRSTNLTVSDIQTDNCPNSAPVQIKFTDGFLGSNFVSDRAGALNMISVRGFAVSGVTARRAQDQNGVGALVVGLQSGDGVTRSADGTLDAVSLVMASEANRAITAVGDRIRGRSVTVTMNRPADNGAPDVSLAGRDSAWEIELFNNGPGTGLGVEVRPRPGVETDGMEVNLRRANRARGALRVSPGATNTRLRYDRALVTTLPGRQLVVDGGSGTRVDPGA